MLAPHPPLGTAVTRLAAPASAPSVPAPPPASPAPAPTDPVRRTARYAWARLLAGIYAVFPLQCLLCGGQIRIIAFITDPSAVRDILRHPGEPSTYRGWRRRALRRCGRCAAPQLELAPPVPEYQFDQRIAW